MWNFWEAVIGRINTTASGLVKSRSAEAGGDGPKPETCEFQYRLTHAWTEFYKDQAHSD